MKKALALLIFLLLGALLVSCGGSGKPSGTTAGGTTAPVTTPPTTTAPPPAPSIQGDSVIVFGSSDSFTVVYGESDSVGKDAAKDLTDAIKGLGINLPAAVSDTSKSESMCELLVGETSRAISAQAKAAIADRVADEPYSEHWIWLYSDGQLALYASSAEAYASAIAEVASKYFSNGEIRFKLNTNDIGYIEHPPVPSMEGNTVTVFGGASSFTIVYDPSNATESEAVSSILSALGGLGISVKTPAAISAKTETQCELIVGDTARAISAEAKSALAIRMASMPDSLHWIWLYKDGQLALYASNAEAYAEAVKELSAKYLASGKICFSTSARDIGLVKVPLPVVQGGMAILFGGSEDFTLVYKENDTVGQTAASNLSTAIGALGLKAPAASADAAKTEGKCELLIGDTSRALSGEAAKLLAAEVEKNPYDQHWIWLYRNGQLALVATDEMAYAAAISELTQQYYTTGGIKMSVNTNQVNYVCTYLEYDTPDNFFDGYTDPFGMSTSDYRKTTVKRVSATKYEISYVDSYGGTFKSEFIQKAWGVWAMGAMSYTEQNGTVHKMTSSSTDYEFVLRIGEKTPTSFRSGNHGDYPGDSNKIYQVDDTSNYNDMLLDLTFYDGKSGAKVTLATGESATLDGLRIVMHHNVYELNYARENVLVTVERSYLYNGADIHLDSKLIVTRDVNIDRSYSCMMPVSKQYGNCALFYYEDGSTYLMKTQTSGGKDDVSLGINATKIDVWGENNPQCHLKIAINNREDMYMSSVTNVAKNGFAGLRNMQGGSTNKIYCSLFSQSGQLKCGTALRFASSWSFSYEPDFQNPTGEPDRWVGLSN